MIKLVLFTGGIETQEYFSLQLEKAFVEMGHEVFLFDLKKEDSEFPRLCRFLEKDNTAMVTFNYHGLNHEKCFYKNNRFLWEDWDIPCFNIVLDHPFYYYKYLQEMPPRYIHLSIDHGHRRFMASYYPNILQGPFLPLAGTEIPNKPFRSRSQDITITGNFTPPRNFELYITRLNDDYTKFYYGIIEDLIAHPALEMDVAFEKHLTREMPELNKGDLALCMEKMIFIDLYVRFYFRGLAVRTLVDSGFPVHVYGGGWSSLECRHPDNLLVGGPRNSQGCLDALADTRISLNVMPWFKDGAHDRIFNSMLNGALSLSDDSTWLRENLEDKKEIAYYSLSEMDKLPGITEYLLSHPKEMEDIANNGYQKARELHTWNHRANVLEDSINSYFKQHMNSVKAAGSKKVQEYKSDS